MIRPVRMPDPTAPSHPRATRRPGPAARSGRRAVAPLLLVALLPTACRAPEPNLDPRGATEIESNIPACASTVPPEGLRIDTLATGLEVPWDVAFRADGGAFVTERPGRIRSFDTNAVLDSEPWAVLEVYARDEVGLMGVDILPGAEEAVYVSATVRSTPSNPVSDILTRVRRRAARALNPEWGHPTTLQVLRLRAAPGDPGRAGTPDVVVSGIPSFLLHGGGAVRFGPDGMLYVSNGDAAVHATAQRPESLRGKILRYTPEGAVPEDNPTVGSPVWALGIRHVQGMTWDDRTGAMLAVDHGPSGMDSEGGRFDRDELNVVEPGANLGWPIVSGMTRGGPFTSPITSWTPAIAPAGLALYTGSYTEEDHAWSGSVFVTGLRGTSLRRLRLEEVDGAPVVACEETLLSSDYGRLRMVREAPDGTLWIGTSNRDGRGVPRGRDDLILRVHPPGA